MRVLYSFPHRLGAERICFTAWQQVNGLAAAGAEVIVCPGSLHRPVAPGVECHSTLSRGDLRIPYKLLGSKRAFALHDYIVARRIEHINKSIDIIHVWPLGCRRTLQTAARLKIPTVLERPNAHTRFAMNVVRQECGRLGVPLPVGHEHSYNEATIQSEEIEYRLADRLLCPSDFVLRTFVESGFPLERLARHQYGFDETVCFPGRRTRNSDDDGLTVLFAGGCAPRKGLHFALEAWVRSSASVTGTFLIAGSFVPGYAELLSPLLAHRSVEVLGHRADLPDIMRRSDVLILPSIEEGSALVTSEARGCGCVLVVSEAAGAICSHLDNALVHRVGDVETISEHLSALARDRALLERLRSESLRTVHRITWGAAGVRLLEVYRETISMVGHRSAILSEGALDAVTKRSDR